MKKSKDTQVWIDSIIALGMIFGAAIGVVFGAFFIPNFLIYTVIAGAGIGFLIGIIVYGIFSWKEKS